MQSAVRGVPFWMLLLLLVASPAGAGPVDEVADTAAEREERSPGAAFALSFAPTVAVAGTGLALIACDSGSLGDGAGGMAEAGLILFAIGSVVGPSAGHLYTEDYGWAVGLGLGRAAFMGLLLGGLFYDPGRTNWSDSDSEGNWFAPDPGKLILMALGLHGLLWLTIWEWVDTPLSARRFNERAAGVEVGLGPLLLPPPPGRADDPGAIGLALSGRF